MTGGPMRVALFHNRYRVRGGEDAIVDREEALLRAAGVEVHRFDLDNETVFARPRLQALHDVVVAPNNRMRARSVARFLRSTGCDVGHVHNWFPLFSPSIYRAHASAGVPVVQTLHNYRLGCASGTLTRDGRYCDSCLGGDRKPAVEHRCYRGSSALTNMWSRVATRGWDAGAFHRDVDLFLAPTQFVADVHIDLGLPAQKVQLLAHGVPDPGNSSAAKEGSGGLFVGRLSPEKGIDAMLSAWASLEVPLRIVGAGPLESNVREAAERNPMVTFDGAVAPEKIPRYIAGAEFLVSPHIAPETFGLAVVEAMASARPVIASNVGGPASILTPGVDGALVPPGDAEALRSAVATMAENPKRTRQMGDAARQTFLERFTEARHVEGLLGAFERVLRQTTDTKAA